MLQEIGSLDKVDAYVAECLEQKKKIMGIGHRVYKTLDPRAPHLKRMAQILSAQLGEPKWIQMSDRIAEIMLKKKISTPTWISIPPRFIIPWAFRPICSPRSLPSRAPPAGPPMCWNNWPTTGSSVRKAFIPARWV